LNETAGIIIYLGLLKNSRFQFQTLLGRKREFTNDAFKGGAAMNNDDWVAIVAFSALAVVLLVESAGILGTYGSLSDRQPPSQLSGTERDLFNRSR
jgi:hypothetical protein